MNNLKAFHYVDSINIVHTVHATSAEHAAVKLTALYDIPAFDAGNIRSHVEFTDERNAALEPMGLAPWQKRQMRAERKYNDGKPWSLMAY